MYLYEQCNLSTFSSAESDHKVLTQRSNAAYWTRIESRTYSLESCHSMSTTKHKLDHASLGQWCQASYHSTLNLRLFLISRQMLQSEESTQLVISIKDWLPSQTGKRYKWDGWRSLSWVITLISRTGTRLMGSLVKIRVARVCSMIALNYLNEPFWQHLLAALKVFSGADSHSKCYVTQNNQNADSLYFSLGKLATPKVVWCTVQG